MTTTTSRKPSVMSFFTFALTVMTAAYFYVAWRTTAPFGAGKGTVAIAFVLAAALVFLPFAMLMLRWRGIDLPLKTAVSWVSYTTMGVVSLLFVLFVARDAMLLLQGGAMFVRDVFGNIARAQGIHGIFAGVRGPWSMSGFSYTSNIAVLALAAFFTVYGMYGAMKTPDVVRVDIPVRNLPEDLAGLTMVQVTDLHVGPTIGKGFVTRVVRRVNSLNPDMVFVTGDLVDGSVGELKDDVLPMKELETRYGVYFTTGNHEYYSGVGPWLEEVKRLGMTPLVNEHVVIETGGSKLVVAGVADYSGDHFSPEHLSSPGKALEGAPDNAVLLLLAHQPRSIFEASEAGCDLQISGHTHGGQYFPWNNFIGMQQPYSHGLHRVKNTWLYVSRGTGYWGPPLRIGQPSEITVFRFVPAR